MGWGRTVTKEPRGNPSSWPTYLTGGGGGVMVEKNGEEGGSIMEAAEPWLWRVGKLTITINQKE